MGYECQSVYDTLLDRRSSICRNQTAARPVPRTATAPSAAQNPSILAVEVTDRSVSLRNAYSVEPRQRCMQAPPQPAAQNLAGSILEPRYIVERLMIQLSQDRLHDCVDMGII